MPKYHHPAVHTSPLFSRSLTMPSPRRVKLLSLLVFLLVVIMLFYTSSIRQQGSEVGDFYEKTMAGLKEKSASEGATIPEDGGKDDEEVAKQMAARLKEAATVAKNKANAKAPKPDPPSALVGVGSAAEGAEKGAAGRKKIAVDEEKQEPIVEETEEERELEAELNNILKKAPVIIFSKSYCPYSRRAKGILLEKYTIDPAPFVVELDQHPLGAKLQAKLGELTGRRTVPNVLVNGVSIGGGDDVAELDTNKKLADKIKELAGNKIVEMALRPIETSDGDHGL